MKNVSQLAAIVFLFLLPVTVSAADYNFYVDTDHTGTEDGTITNPYNTIGEAIAAAALNASNARKIFVSAGTYNESVELGESVKLYGENKNTTIINGSGTANSYAVKMKNNTYIKNMAVTDNTYGILVDSKSKATIEKCNIYETSVIGIRAEREGGNKELTITDSKIHDNSGKGIYIQKKWKIKISGNEIYDNDEEGIDTRELVKGTISKNTIYDNGESGIELVVGKSKLKITNNTLKNNDASGIANQFYKETKKTGVILIADNKIRSNSHYGVTCKTPSGAGGEKSSTYWKDSLTFSENVFSQNGKSAKDDIKNTCLK